MTGFPSLTPFEGKVITVAGASRGVGLALAKYLLVRGASLSISSSSPDNIAKAVADIEQELPQHKDRVLSAACDVTKLDQVEAWIALTMKHYGKIHGCANVSGKEQRRLFPITHLSSEDWNELIDVNLNGMFHLLKEEMKVIADGGSIVNVSSVSARCASAGFAGYCASKAGLSALSKCAAFEGAARSIRVNTISPGGIKTEMTAGSFELMGGGEFYSNGDTMPGLIKRFAEPEEIAAAIAYLLGDDSKFVTKADWAIDGGFMEVHYAG